MSKILILANSDVGMYKFRVELLEELLADKHELFLLMPYGVYSDRLKKLGCFCIDTPVDRRGTNPLRDFFLFLRYLRGIRRVRPDFVLSYTVKPNLYGGAVCQLLGVPYALHITGLGTALQRSYWFRPLVRGLYRFVGRRAKVVFLENSADAALLADNGDLPGGNTCVLPGAGVNLDHYPFTDYPSATEQVRFLFAGRIMKEKGVEELFDAARLLFQCTEKVVFDLVGPFEEDYRETVHELEKSGILCYYGVRDSILPYLQRCHCLVLPSYHEGMANVLLEAGAVGRPLITTRIPGCMEAAVEGKTGFLCEAGSSAALFQQLSRFTKLSHAERKRMGRESRKHIQTNFDRRKVVRTILKKLPLSESVL